MSDTDPSATPSPDDGDSELHGLDPGELLARGLHTVKPTLGMRGWEPPATEELARLLPAYQIESLIGRGGMGAVYKGVQLNLDRPVAIKLLPVEIAADSQFVARFEREARTLARLQHSRIVTIHDFGRTSEGHLYFVMEFIDGTDLRHILRGPGLDPEQALVVVGQLCDALQAAHREGIVHRDIKPENVLITKDGYVKLADFGLSRPPQENGHPQLTWSNVVMGTPDYMAPEQRDGAAKADHRSDIFALGVMLYEMLTGQTPRGVFTPPSRKAQVDARIDEVVLKALQSEPEQRYQEASELKTAVEHIRTTPLPVVAPSPAEIYPKNHALRIAPVAAAAVAIIVGLGTVWLTRGGSPAVQSSSVLAAAPDPSSQPTPDAKVKQQPDSVPAPSKASPSMPIATPLPATPPPAATASEAKPIRAKSQDAAPLIAAPILPPPPGTVGQRAGAVPWPPVPDKGGDPKNMERMIYSFGWETRNNGTLYFRPDHLLVCKTNNSVFRMGHWWSTGSNTIHVQNAHQPSELDPNVGGDMTFNANFTEVEVNGFPNPPDDTIGWRANVEAQSTTTAIPNSVVASAIQSPQRPAAPVTPQPITAQQPVSAPPVAEPPKGGQPMIQILADQAPNVANWITAPLGRAVPGEISLNITFLKEALRDEAAKNPVASPMAYQLAVKLCYTLAANLEIRVQTETIAVGGAVLQQKSNLTEWRRDHLTWPMYFLERDERAERQGKAKNPSTLIPVPKLQEWVYRTQTMRSDFDVQYSQFREALRKSPPTRQ